MKLRVLHRKGCQADLYTVALYNIIGFNKDNTVVINHPLGQTHSLASSEHCFLLLCFVIFEKWGRTDR